MLKYGIILTLKIVLQFWEPPVNGKMVNRMAH